MDEKLTLKARLTAFEEEMSTIEILKSKAAYGYNYADLPAILDIVLPILKKHGISYYHHTYIHDPTAQNVVRTVLFNVDDEKDTLVSENIVHKETILPKQNQLMMEGSAITYYRRFQLTAMLKLTTDEDTDAGGKRKDDPKAKSSTKAAGGRSVEAAGADDSVDYIKIFENLVIKKDKDKVLKTLAMYKAQIDNEQYNKIENLIEEAYENK